MTGSGRSPASSIPPVLIRGGRIVDPASAFDAVADLLLRDGIISERAAGIQPPPGSEVIDATGQVVTPGFVDLHTHLRFPGFPEKEAMASGTAAAAAGGFTTVCAMANTQPVVDDVAVLREVQEEARREGRVRVLQLAAVSLGLQGRRPTDMPALARAGAVAFSDDGKPVWDAHLMEEALATAAALGLPVSVHEEDPALVGDGVANSGATARRLGLPPWPCAGEAGMVERDIALLERVGGRLHIAHVSCAASVALVREAKTRHLPVTAEVTPHHLRFTDRLLAGDRSLHLPPADPSTKVNPPLRSPRDAAALVEALADGTIDAVATDHAPHTVADKAPPYQRAAFGFSGLETALPLLLDLVRDGRLPLATAIERLTIGPAAAFGLQAGTLQVGAPADVCIFDPDMTWSVQPETLRSRGKNTPLLGATLRGRVTATLVGGAVVHRL